MNKVAINIFLLTLYLAAMLRPAIPMAIYYANYDYIANELCENRNKPVLECNGTCYVETMMEKSNLLPTENSQETILTESSLFFPIFILEELAFELIQYSIKELKLSIFTNNFILSEYTNSIDYPPEIA